jgi:predicted RNA-binding Zn ribbon-like protein
MNLRERPAATMKMVGGRLCLDFVNTVGGRESDPAAKKGAPDAVIILRDKLNDYWDLLAWSQRAGLVSEGQAQALIRESKRLEDEAAGVFLRAVALREAIYRICKALMQQRPPRTADIELLNEELREARRHERLSPAVGRGFVWQWVDTKGALDRMLWPVVSSAAELLSEGDLTRLRECGGEECHWLFEDTSKNRRRQWCDMQDCGNLAKVRRFRTRLRDSGKGQPS